jgi:hypothetical protein
MRTLLLTSVFIVLSALSTPAQDPGAEAAQAAAQAAQQASLQAMQAAQQQAQQQMLQMQQDSQRASDQFTQQMMQDANSASLNAARCCGYAAKPTFSVKAGTYSTAQQVRIRDTTRDAVIYYTTDGWTPTIASKRYTGPITIDTTTTLQAIAIVPSALAVRSLVANAQYTVSSKPGAQPVTSAALAPVPVSTEAGQIRLEVPAADSAVANAPSQFLLPQGMRVHLVFAAAVNSKTAEVGDKIALTVDQEIKMDDQVVVPVGTPALATITHVNHTGPGGAPGDIAFDVQSMNVNGNTVELCGSNVLEGDPKPPNATTLIPVVGMFTIFRHGKDAEIRAGMPVTATVYADTVIPAAPKVNTPSH